MSPMPTATATDPLHDNSPTMHSMLFHQERQFSFWEAAYLAKAKKQKYL